jgi:putative endonuclease
MAWVYILKCRDGSYYTGSTTNLEHRLAEHQSGAYEGHTYSRRPVTLVFSYETSTLDDAFQLERQIKGWSRAKKEALIAGRYDLLPELARSRHPKQP